MRVCCTAAVIVLTLFAACMGLAAEFSDEFDGSALDTEKWTPYSLTFSHAGTITVSGGMLEIQNDAQDPLVIGSRFGVLSNVVFGDDAVVEARISEFSGVNAIMRLVGPDGAFIEWAIDNNQDAPLHVWRSYPDGDKGFDGGKGATTPITLGVSRKGNNFEFYTVDAAGQKTVHAARTAANMPRFRVFLYGYETSGTIWDSFRGTGALPSAVISGKVSGPSGPLAGARVSVNDTLFPPVFTDSEGKYRLVVSAGDHTLMAAAIGMVAQSKVVTVSGATSVDFELAAAPAPPVYDDFSGNALNTAKWTTVTVEGGGAATYEVANGTLTITGSTDPSWRRHGVMSTAVFDASFSVMQFKLDSVSPSGHPFVALWDAAGVPNWNTQPHVEVHFNPDNGRLELPGGRAPWVSAEADQYMYAPFTTDELPAVLTVIRTGKTWDFYIKGKNDAADRLMFSATTGNLLSNHRLVVYGFTPQPVVDNPTVTTWDYVAASNEVRPATLTVKVTVKDQPAAGAGVLIRGIGTSITGATDASGSVQFKLDPGEYEITAVTYGYDRAKTVAKVTSGESQTVTVAISTPSPLFSFTTYDDFDGTTLDTSKWSLTSEEGQGVGEAIVANGELELRGPGAGNRWGVMTQKTFSASGSAVEVKVNTVDEFGPAAINALLQLYGGTGAFTNFLEFGAERLDESGLPVLHVFGPESGDFHQTMNFAFPAEPLVLTAVRRGSDFDFFANGRWFYSTSSQRLPGDHRIFLYGYGSSISHWDWIKVAEAAPVLRGDLDGNGKITIADATIALRIAVGLVQPTPEQITAAADATGKITVAMATVILRAVVFGTPIP